MNRALGLPKATHGFQIRISAENVLLQESFEFGLGGANVNSYEHV